MMKSLKILANLGLLALVLIVWQARAYLSSPIGGTQTVAVAVSSGDTLRLVLHRLADKKFLSYPDLLYSYARLANTTVIRTGSYEFFPTQTPLGILRDLEKGRVQTERLTIVDGWNRWQIRDALAQDGWLDAAKFDALCDDLSFLESNQIPGPTCEGYLFPETYEFARGVSAKTLFRHFFEAYKSAIQGVTNGAYGPMGLSEREFTTLASIVEKETGAAVERPRIACVFYNRLQAKPWWRLQTDPTVIYAATLENPKFDGNLKRSHLRRMKNPYNTYLNYGLPPGPIASPGLAAMKAVQTPSTCKDFFFVSKNNGEHVFCPTLACHNAAVKTWQINFFRRK